MNDQTRDQLNRFYSNLRNQLTLNKRLKDNSALMSVISVKSNEAYKLLVEAGIKTTTIPMDAFNSLRDGGFIRMAEKPDNYTITVRGVWEIESATGIMTTARLLDRIDRKFFDLFNQSGQLREKDKVLLLAMIAARSFSAESALDLKKGETLLSHLQSLLESSFQLLVRYRVICKVKLAELFGAPGNEHPVSNMIRHTDQLLKQTKGIYKTLGRQQRYYLDLFNGEAISEDGLVTLFGYIFGASMTPELKAELIAFCSRNAYECSFYLFDLNVHRFANPIYDEQLNEALEQYYAARYRWEGDRADDETSRQIH